MSHARIGWILASSIALFACSSAIDEQPSPKGPSQPSHETPKTDVVPEGPVTPGFEPTRVSSVNELNAPPPNTQSNDVHGFQPVSGIAMPCKRLGWREVRLYDAPATCESRFGRRDGERRISFLVPWKSGEETRASDASMKSSVYSLRADDWTSRPITDGMVRVLDANDGDASVARIQVALKDGNEPIQTTIDVKVCER